MRVCRIAVLALAVFTACAAPADKGAGPDTSAPPALVDFTATAVTLGGVELQEPVSVLVRDARGTVITSSAVSWTSDNPSVVEVSGTGATGTLRARSPGTAKVRAKAGNAASEITVRVLAVRSVKIAETAVTLRARESASLTAIVDGEEGVLRNVRWSSDNATVAIVNAQGVLTATGTGSTTVHAAAVGDPRASASVTVNVTEGRAVVITPGSMVLWVGDSDSLRAQPEVDGTQSRDVSWSSANPSVASISASGVVTAVGVGTTKVRATAIADARVQGEAEVRILPARTVAVSPATSTLNIGTSRTLAATVSIEDGLSTAVTWRSSNPSIVSVSGAGVATGVSLGTVSVTATSVADTSRHAAATITVTPVIRGVSLSPSAIAINTGESETAIASVDAEGSLARTVSWRSSNATIASVSSTGAITGVAAGQATITALSTVDTTKRATLTVTVRTAPAIFVTPQAVTMASGDQRTLVATVRVEAGQDNRVTWRSGNPDIASVSQGGVVTAIALGNATITAISVEDTTQRATSAITVAPIVRSISVTPATASLLIGQLLTLTTSVVADAGLSQGVLWRSSNNVVASVSASGMVTAIMVGSATITAMAASDTTKRATMALTVASRPVSITVSPSSMALNIGAATQLQGVVTGDPDISLGVTWSTSNSSLATVSATGVVTGVSAGSVTITGTAVADVSKKATATVVVGGRLATSWTAARAGGALHEDVLSLTSFSTSAAFSVNVVGDVYRWDGSAWSLSARGGNYGTQFTAVHGSSASNVIAVGTNGIVVRFDGSAWTAMPSGTAATLLDVFVEGAGNAFVAGANGTILRLSGSTWTTMTSGTTASLNGIWSGGGIAVAVGAGGEVLRFAQGIWLRQSVPTLETLYSVAGTSATNIVAVGSAGTVLRFNGTDWTRISSNGVTSDLYSVDGSTSTGGRWYIASDAGLLQFDGTAVTAVSTPYQPRMFSAAVDGSGNVWVGGQRGAVFRGSNGTFSTISLAPDLLDVWSTSATEAWAVGEFGFIYRFANGAWTRQTAPTTATLNSVWAAGSNEAFAGGDNGTMLRWNGNAWAAMTLPSPSSVYAVWGTSGSDVYAVTVAGWVFHFNGSSWSTSTTVSGPLWAVYGLSPTEVYVSGENGRLLRFDGTTWTPQSPTSAGTLAGLWMSAGSNVLAVGSDGAGANGIAYRYDGSTWLAQAMGTNRVLTSAWGPSASDVYATGDQGTMLRFNGTSWQAMSTGTTDLLWSVTGAPNGSGGAFAVGYNGTIVTGASAGSLSAAASMRSVSRGAGLEPSAQARRDPRGLGPLPTGAARRNRKSAASASAATQSAARTGLQLVKYGPRKSR
jgi:uncharacterized protein YjdB